MKLMAYNHMNNVRQPFVFEEQHDLHREMHLPSPIQALANGIMVITLSKLWTNKQKLAAFESLDNFFHDTFGKGFDAVAMGTSDCSDTDDVKEFFGTVPTPLTRVAILYGRDDFFEKEAKICAGFNAVSISDGYNPDYRTVIGADPASDFTTDEIAKLAASADRLSDFFYKQGTQNDAWRQGQPTNYKIAI